MSTAGLGRAATMLDRSATCCARLQAFIPGSLWLSPWPLKLTAKLS